MSTFFRKYLSDPGTYPLFGVMGAAFGLLGFWTVNKISGSNDVTFLKNYEKIFTDKFEKFPWKDVKDYKGDPFGFYSAVPKPRKSESS